MKPALLALSLCLLLVAAVNAGALYDRLAYGPLLARVRTILPPDWRTLADDAAGLAARQTDAQRSALEAAFARFDTRQGGVVLLLPVGLDTEEFHLADGCFRFPRRTLNLIVWQFDIRTGCL